MTAGTQLERDLTTWLSETAMPQTPDYADEILDTTRRIHQRPRWTFLGRWLPIPNVGRFAPVEARNVLRVAALLVVLGLILAAIAAVVGSRRSAPPPFGIAGNGLVAYEDGGAIRVVDPKTLASRSIGGDAAFDHDPAWALDGTRVAFVRESAGGQVLVVADTTGRVLAVSEAFSGIDPDTIEWSPDGRHIAINATAHSGPGLYLVDTMDGKLRAVGVEYSGLEIFWRPPDGKEILYQTGGSDPGLRIVSLDDGTVQRVPPNQVDPSLRPLGWTPDGQAILYQQAVGSGRELTYVADIQTGTERRLDVSVGHVSNDGTRVVGLDASNLPCIVAITGGACRAIPNTPGWLGYTGAAVTWSPDDRWIAIFDDGSAIWLVDVTGAAAPRQVASSGTPSWQRIAP